MIINGEEKVRAGTVTNWYRMDFERTYSPTNGTGPNYSPTEIEYRFNSHGFRCDEFPDESSPERAPILFMGCSFTEGVGLPLHHCWPHFILEKMKAMPKYAGKHIPFYSLAIAGSGVDTAARVLMDHIDRIKPNIICYLLPSIYRREYSFNSYTYRGVTMMSLKLNNGEIPLFADKHYAQNQTYRSLHQLELLARLNDTKIILFSISMGELLYCQNSFSHISIYQSEIPLYEPFLDDFPVEIASAPEKARDNAHPGVKWQYKMANWMWDRIEPELISVVEK